MWSFLAGIPGWVWLPLLLVTVLVGFVTLLRRGRALRAGRTFAIEFRRHFLQYANSNGRDHEAYHWMTLNSNRMQVQMGDAGIMASFRDPPFAYRNYPAVLNMLPLIRRDMNDGLLHGHAVELTHMFDELLVRYFGSIEHSTNEAAREIRNPLRWFFAGVEQIVSIPLYFILSFGIISVSTIGYLQKTLPFKFFSALIVLLGIVASVISVVNDGKTALGHLRAFVGL